MSYHFGEPHFLTVEMDKTSAAPFLINLSQKFYGLTAVKVRKLAFKFALPHLKVGKNGSGYSC